MVVSGVSTFLGSQKGINVVGVSSFAGAINANGGVVGNLTGNLDASGNAGTATKLATARTIGGVSFDGSAAINLPVLTLQVIKILQEMQPLLLH